jgi:hypothetical protein
MRQIVGSESVPCACAEKSQLCLYPLRSRYQIIPKYKSAWPRGFARGHAPRRRQPEDRQRGHRQPAWAVRYPSPAHSPQTGAWEGRMPRSPPVARGSGAAIISGVRARWAANTPTPELPTAEQEQAGALPESTRQRVRVRRGLGVPVNCRASRERTKSEVSRKIQ